MLTVQSDVASLHRVVVCRPGDAFGSQAEVDRSWRRLGYVGAPDLEAAESEHDAFVGLLRGAGVDVHYLDASIPVGMDALYPRDASVICRDGAVLCRMGKESRMTEPEAHAATYATLGVPVLGNIRGDGRLEGGDVAWLDERTLVAGLGYRTNPEGVRQLRDLLGDRIETLIEVPLPHWRGPGDVFHLMSMLSPLSESVLLVYSPLLPVFFRRELLERGFQLVEVPEEEFETMGANALAVNPERCMLLAGNPRTRGRIERSGIEVLEYEGRQISTLGSGGPTCLTRPVSRLAVDSDKQGRKGVSP
ncbi:MAG: arginine deiminase family protein [marine benthic group bacterium]|jgi:N-dimethylarginine dimethylaminohydrolase|nr:arginine deiminase family protein [Gemmatimonadota bacterium]MCL7962306.1 arginine deiminase family protein [Candidatus Carthagonibacter metallireducens]MCL7956386.1 arginine deiminase family protein [Gemmatimonadota bacterium]MCL7965332.1 arginine deiminase family protein [Gemmatimonadota bacterium]MCL7968672.1 arginine deiminase family protein [Gemmatimonadota bacterium]